VPELLLSSLLPEQVQRLLDGKSYATIPHVLIPIQPDPPLDA